MLIDEDGQTLEVLADWQEFLRERLGARGDKGLSSRMAAGLASAEEVLEAHPELADIAAAPEAEDLARRFMRHPSLIKTATDAEIVEWFGKIGADYGFMTSVSDQTWIMQDLIRVLDPELATLDVGCGVMPHLNFLVSRGLLRGRVTGIDPSARILSRAAGIARSEEVECDFVCSFGSSLPFSSSSFGQVIAIDSLHWTSEWRESLAEIARVTIDDGPVLVVYSKFAPRRTIDPMEAVNCLSQGGIDVREAIGHSSIVDTPRVVIGGVKQKPRGIIVLP